MLGFAHEFDLFLDGFLMLGLRLQRLPPRHRLVDSFRESEGLRKTGLPHSDLCGSCREMQAYAYVRMADCIQV